MFQERETIKMLMTIAHGSTEKALSTDTHDRMGVCVSSEGDTVSDAYSGNILVFCRPSTAPYLEIAASHERAGGSQYLCMQNLLE